MTTSEAYASLTSPAGCYLWSALLCFASGVILSLPPSIPRSNQGIQHNVANSHIPSPASLASNPLEVPLTLHRVHRGPSRRSPSSPRRLRETIPSRLGLVKDKKKAGFKLPFFHRLERSMRSTGLSGSRLMRANLQRPGRASEGATARRAGARLVRCTVQYSTVLSGWREHIRTVL
jgi:hypothetical protein